MRAARLVIAHGASCGTDFGAYTAPSVIDFDPAADLIEFPVHLPATATVIDHEDQDDERFVSPWAPR